MIRLTRSEKASRMVFVSLIAYLFISVLSFFNPPAAHAANFPYWGTSGILPCLAYSDTRCTSWCDVLQLLQNLSYLLFTYILLAATPIGLISGGAIMMTSGGSEKRYTLGRKVITFCLKWAIITFAIWAIFNFILGLGWLKINGGGQTNISWPDITCTYTGDKNYNPLQSPTTPCDPNGSIPCGTSSPFNISGSKSTTNTTQPNLPNGTIQQIDPCADGSC